jgi:sensor histidine kinase YesM
MNLPQNLPMSGREIIYCASVVLENILRYLVVLIIAMNTKVKMVKRQNVIFELLYIPLVCLFILFGVICYVILAYRIQEKHLRYGMEIVACSVNLIVCVLSLKLNKMYCNRLHMNAYLQYMQIKDEYFHQIEAQQDEVRRIKHDLKNHMIYLQGLLATGEIKDAATYIKEVIGQDEIIGNTTFTANSAVNIILNAKQTRMQKEKLQFVYNIEMPGKLGIKEKDIVTIIGNILDNAIEAAKKCETPGTIELLVRYHASRLVIQCKNPTDDKEVRMVTGKRDKIHHGIGLRNVSRIAEWYEGIMTREIQDGKFVITISLLEDDSCKDGEWKMTAVQ